MDHSFTLENSSSAAAYTLPNTIIYLKAVKYLNIRLRHLLNQSGTSDKGVKDWGSNTVLLL